MRTHKDVLASVLATIISTRPSIGDTASNVLEWESDWFETINLIQEALAQKPLGFIDEDVLFLMRDGILKSCQLTAVKGDDARIDYIPVYL